MMKLSLLVTTFLISLVTGLVWTFATIIMPGIRSLEDREFLQAFKAIDGVIQRSQPAFVLVWLGSLVMITLTGGLGYFLWDGVPRILLLLATALYLFGLQLPTMAVNIPLNNQLKAQDLGALGEEALSESREQFEAKWVWWNEFRTRVGLIVVFLLLTLMLLA